MPRGSVLLRTKQGNQYLFVADKTGWTEIGMHIITHTHARHNCAFLWVCVRPSYLCMCAVHSYKDNHALSPPLFLHFPRDKVPISPSPAARQKDRCEREREERWGKEKTQMLSALRESLGSLSCVSQSNTTPPDKPARLRRLAATGDSAIPFCAGAPDETRN